MNKKMKKFALSLAVFGFLAGVVGGTMVVAPMGQTRAKANTIETTLEKDVFGIVGAGVRLINDANGTGLRFHTTLAEDEAAAYLDITQEGIVQLKDGYTSGTLIIPEVLYDGELTLADMDYAISKRPVQIDTSEVWYDSDTYEGYYQATSYMYDIPASSFGVRMVAVSYITDGTNTYYTPATEGVSMSDVAAYVQNSDTYTELVKEQVSPYVVETANVTWKIPNVTEYVETTETVGYGSTITAPALDLDEGYVCVGWKDQRGKVWDFESDELTLKTTLTPVIHAVKGNTDAQLAANQPNAIIGGYLGGGAIVKNNDVSGVLAPKGFTSVTRYDSKSWVSGYLASACYNRTPLTEYFEAFVSFKIVNGFVSFPGGTVQVRDGSWVHAYMKNVSTEGQPLWEVAFTNDAGDVLYKKTQSGTANGANKPVDSLAKVLFDDNDNGVRFYHNGDGTTASIYTSGIRANATTYTVTEGEKITDPTNVQPSSVIGGYLGSMLKKKADVSAVDVPEGYEGVTGYDIGSGWTSSILTSQYWNRLSLTAYTDVYFAVYVANGNLQIPNGTTYSNQWMHFYLTQTAAHIWTVELSKADGTVVYTKTGADASENNASYSASNRPVDSLALFVAHTSYTNNVSNGIRMNYAANLAIYSTELQTRKEVEKSYLKEKLVGEKITDPTNIQPSSVIGGYLGTMLKKKADVSGVDVPEGYEGVTGYDIGSGWTSGILLSQYWNRLSLTAYTDVYFAVYVANGTIKVPTGATYSNQWMHFHLTQTAAHIWTIELSKADGTVVYTKTGADASENNASYSASNRPVDSLALSVAVSSTANISINYAPNLVIYSTELQYRYKEYYMPTIPEYVYPSEEVETPVYDPEIDEMSETALKYLTVEGYTGGKYVAASDVSESTSKPVGFNNVFSLTSSTGWTSGALQVAAYSKTSDLSKYSDLWFALKLQNAYFRIQNTDYKVTDWIYFHFEQTGVDDNGNGIWKLTITQENGKQLTCIDEISGAKTSSNKPKDALSTILYRSGSSDGVVIYYGSETSNSAVIYSTEIVGVLKTYGTRVVASALDGATLATGTTTATNTEIVDMGTSGQPCAIIGGYLGGGALVKNADVSGVATPNGFDSIVRYDSSTAWTKGDLAVTCYNRFMFTDHTDVSFAFMVQNGTVQLPITNKVVSAGTWIYVHMYQVAETTWLITYYDVNGNVYVRDLQSGAGSTTGNTPMNSLAKMVFNPGWVDANGDGNNDSREGSMILHNGAGNTVSIYSTELRSGANKTFTAKTTEFDAVYKKTYNAGDFSARNLSSLGYEELRFKIWWDGAAIAIPNSNAYACLHDVIAYDDTEMKDVTITKTATGWNVAMDVNVISKAANGEYVITNGYTFTTTANSLKAIFADWTFNATNATVWVTELRGVHICSIYEYVSLEDGTHRGVCACGKFVSEAEVCSGGSATCKQHAICTFCGAEYGDFADHNPVWESSEYVCSVCGENLLSVKTELDSQTLALYTDATNIDTTVAVEKTLDVSAITTQAFEITNVKLDGKDIAYTANGSSITVNLLPSVFGEQTFVVTISLYENTFEITVPTLIVTDLIKTTDGFVNMLTFVRTDMGGKGYYQLGAKISLANKVYPILGTSNIPFVGTLDGNGYEVYGFRRSNWFSNYGTTAQVAAGTKTVVWSDETNNSYKEYLEGSLFGVVNGTIKNLGLTGTHQGIYSNIVHSGTGLIENVYLSYYAVQSAGASYVPPFFAKGELSAGTLRNVVVNVTADTNWNTSSQFYITNASNTSKDAISALIPGVVGKNCVCDNVAVFGMYRTYTSSLGTVWTLEDKIYVSRTNVSSDGAEENIHVSYQDGTTNGIPFSASAFNNAYNDMWKIVNGVPVLKNCSTTTADDTIPGEQTMEFNGYIYKDGATDYVLGWYGTEGAANAGISIYQIAEAATGVFFESDYLSPMDTTRRQIIVGTYADFAAQVGNPALKEGFQNYGVYLVENTIFVLADSEGGFEQAVKLLCGKLFGYRVFDATDGGVAYNTVSTLEIPTSDSFNYTTWIAFDSAILSNAATDNGASLGFDYAAPYYQYEGEHNITAYLPTDIYSTYYNNTAEQYCFLGKGTQEGFEGLTGAAANAILGVVKANPTIETINFSVNDNEGYCTCAYCSKITNKSATLVLFLNKVLEKVNADAELRAAGRTIKIVTFAYHKYETAPVIMNTDVLPSYVNYSTATVTYPDNTKATVLTTDENLKIYWTSSYAYHSYALTDSINAEIYKGLLGWVASCTADNVWVYMYQTYFSSYLLPFNTWEYQVSWYETLNELGVHSFINNLGQYNTSNDAQTAFTAFKTYIDSRKMKDGAVSFETLKSEFFGENGYYGAGGPSMEKFFDELVAYMESQKATSNYFKGFYGTARDGVEYLTEGNTTFKLNSTLFESQAKLEGWLACCNTALAAVGENSIYSKRIQMESVFPYYAILIGYSTVGEPTMTESGIAPNYHYNSMVAPSGYSYSDFYNLVVNICGIARFAENENSKVDDTQSSAYLWSYGLADYYVYRNWFKAWGCI